MTFAIKQNDTSPIIAATLKDADGTAIDLSGATVRFHMRKIGKSAVSVDAAASVTNASQGKIQYAWSATDTATIGTYQGEFEVTYTDNKVETFPNSGYIAIEVTDDLA